VTATYNTATSANGVGDVGMVVVGALSATDSAPPFHTLISHNTTNGFSTGFGDLTAPGPTVEKWIDNTADNYAQSGFVFAAPIDYTITGNVADANTSAGKYTGGSTAGFKIGSSPDPYPPALFSDNAAYDNQIGFLSEFGIGGTGNIAKHNLVNSIGVEITG
jgi:hypothetical protein